MSVNVSYALLPGKRNPDSTRLTIRSPFQPKVNTSTGTSSATIHFAKTVLLRSVRGLIDVAKFASPRFQKKTFTTPKHFSPFTPSQASADREVQKDERPGLE